MNKNWPNNEPIKPGLRLFILERDNWICQKCGCSTPKELQGTFDPRAPEVDHIIPRRFPESTNDPSNLRCLCHGCNQPHEVHLLGGKNGNKKLSREDRVKGGRIGGKIAGAKAVQSGQLKKFAAAGGRIGGKIKGLADVESGFWASLKTPEHQSKAAKKARHLQWHTRRGIINPNCELCVSEGVPA